MPKMAVLMVKSEKGTKWEGKGKKWWTPLHTFQALNPRKREKAGGPKKGRRNYIKTRQFCEIIEKHGYIIRLLKLFSK